MSFSARVLVALVAFVFACGAEYLRHENPLLSQAGSSLNLYLIGLLRGFKATVSSQRSLNLVGRRAAKKLDVIATELILKEETLQAKTHQIEALKPPRKKILKQAPNERFATIDQVKKTQEEMDKEDTRRERFLTQSTPYGDGK